jgi:hypothetical protein
LEKSNNFLSLTTVPVCSDTLKKFIQIKSLLLSPFVGGKATRREDWEKGLLLNPYPQKWNKILSLVVYRTRGRLGF